MESLKNITKNAQETIFRCVSCASSLQEQGGGLVCTSCPMYFASDDGIYLFCENQNNQDLKEMHDLVAKMPSYEIAPESDISAHFRLPNRPFTLATLFSERKNFSTFFSRFKINQNAKVLNISCGIGREAQALLASGVQSLHLLDISLPAVKHAKESFERFYPSARLSYCVADAQCLPFNSNSFDVVFVYASAHHYRDIYVFLDEAMRVSRRVVICAEPAHMGIFHAFLSIIGWNTEYGHLDTHRINERELCEFLSQRNASFQIERNWHYYPRSLDFIGNTRWFVWLWFAFLRVLDYITPSDIRHSITIDITMNTPVPQ